MRLLQKTKKKFSSKNVCKIIGMFSLTLERLEFCVQLFNKVLEKLNLENNWKDRRSCFLNL